MSTSDAVVDALACCRSRSPPRGLRLRGLARHTWASRVTPADLAARLAATSVAAAAMAPCARAAAAAAWQASAAASAAQAAAWPATKVVTWLLPPPDRPPRRPPRLFVATPTCFGVPHFLQENYRSKCAPLHTGFEQIQSPSFAVTWLLAVKGRGAPHWRHSRFRSNWWSPQCAHIQSP